MSRPEVDISANCCTWMHSTWTQLFVHNYYEGVYVNTHIFTQEDAQQEYNGKHKVQGIQPIHICRSRKALLRDDTRVLA